jgi:hypothetical protein
MPRYALNIAEKTNLQFPAARHWGLVEFGEVDRNLAMSRAYKLIENMGRDKYVYTFVESPTLISSHTEL